jgi:hypothetical protein
MMSENTRVHLKWIYSPIDFFEEREISLLSDYENIIENGEVTVSMDLNEYQSLSGIQEQLYEQLLSIFKGAALVSQKPFVLKTGGQEIVFLDGHKKIIMPPISLTMNMTVLAADFITSDPQGNVIVDSKSERQQRRRNLSMLSAKYRNKDEVVESILSSFERSLNNPETELVHLYEIRDTLSTKFNGEGTAKHELGISSSKWRRLGQLANDEPINQGRHNGIHIGVLRDATEGELKEARNIAIEMVSAYLDYLEKKFIQVILMK